MIATSPSHFPRRSEQVLHYDGRELRQSWETSSWTRAAPTCGCTTMRTAVSTMPESTCAFFCVIFMSGYFTLFQASLPLTLNYGLGDVLGDVSQQNQTSII
jgi:hypothetical protein